jgi:RND superfamily putative drug exporter
MDAFLIRGTLVPAFMRLAGDWNWWAPGPLRRFHARWGISETVDLGAIPAATTRSTGTDDEDAAATVRVIGDDHATEGEADPDRETGDTLTPR